MCERIQNERIFYETYKVYLTKNLEIAALVVEAAHENEGYQP